MVLREVHSFNSEGARRIIWLKRKVFLPVNIGNGRIIGVNYFKLKSEGIIEIVSHELHGPWLVILLGKLEKDEMSILVVLLLLLLHTRSLLYIFRMWLFIHKCI